MRHSEVLRPNGGGIGHIMTRSGNKHTSARKLSPIRQSRTRRGRCRGRCRMCFVVICDHDGIGDCLSDNIVQMVLDREYDPKTASAV